MNAALRIFTWLLALALVALPVVAVVNGWIGADRWPLTKLRVHGQFERVDSAQLQAVVLPYFSFLGALGGGRGHSFAQLPWRAQILHQNRDA